MIPFASSARFDAAAACKTPPDTQRTRTVDNIDAILFAAGELIDDFAAGELIDDAADGPQLRRLLAELRLEADIQELERAWAAEENRLASGTTDGIGGTLPTAGASGTAYALLILSALVWFVSSPSIAEAVSTSHGARSILGRFVPLTGYALLGYFAWRAVERNRRAIAYDAGERRYRKERAALLARRSEPVVASADEAQDAEGFRRQLEAIRRTIEICRVDREWDEERQQYMTTQQSVGLSWGEVDTGSTSSGFLRPSRARALRIGFAMSGLGAVLFYAAVAMHSASGLRTSIGLVGVVLIAAAVFTVPSELSRAARYDEAERAYLARRERAAGGDASEQPSPRSSA